jgi:hypothetical protein
MDNNFRSWAKKSNPQMNSSHYQANNSPRVTSPQQATKKTPIHPTSLLPFLSVLEF